MRKAIFVRTIFSTAVYLLGPFNGLVFTSFLCAAFGQSSPFAEGALRHQIESLENERPDYDEMTADLAREWRSQSPSVQQALRKLGPLKSLTFKEAGVQGWFVFDVTFEHGQSVWKIAPLSSTGLLSGLYYIPLASGAPEHKLEYSCIGPRSVSGTVIGPATIAMPGFQCLVGGGKSEIFGDEVSPPTGPLYQRHISGDDRRIVPMQVELKNTEDGVRLKIAARVTVKGHFYRVEDIKRQSEYLVVRDAEVE